MRTLTLTLILSASLLSAGCSLMRAGYDRLDWITLVWMDRYLDLNSDQKAALRPQLRQLLVWHRQNELPAYLALIENDLEPLLKKDDIPASDWLFLMDRLKVRYVALARHAAEQAEPLAASLGSDQIAALKQSYEKSNVKFRKKHLDLPMAEVRENRADDFAELIDDWTGHLSDAQQAAVRRSYQQRSIDNMQWWEERLIRQQLVLRALQKKQGEAAPTLSDAFLSLLDPVSPKGQQYLERTHRDTAELLSEIWRLSTPAQKQRVREKALAWKADIRKLM